MSKKSKTYKEFNVCKNYAKFCPITNNCNNCKNRVMGRINEKFGVIKCKKANDINGQTKYDCFECLSEGSSRCKKEYD